MRTEWGWITINKSGGYYTMRCGHGKRYILIAKVKKSDLRQLVKEIEKTAGTL